MPLSPGSRSLSAAPPPKPSGGDTFAVETLLLRRLESKRARSGGKQQARMLQGASRCSKTSALGIAGHLGSDRMIQIRHKDIGEVLHTVHAPTLEGVDLPGMSLIGADLRGANLEASDLRSA